MPFISSLTVRSQRAFDRCFKITCDGDLNKFRDYLKDRYRIQKEFFVKFPTYIKTTLKIMDTFFMAADRYGIPFEEIVTDDKDDPYYQYSSAFLSQSKESIISEN
jgi:hypothetical protein